MFRFRMGFLTALALSLGIHVSLLRPWPAHAPPTPPQPLQVRIVDAPVREEKRIATPSRKNMLRGPDSIHRPAEKALASMAAPPAPSAEEWQLASTYTPRNSKRYRHAWGQQVRSMMGTAVEGPDQGMVRFRIEIAPDGKVARIEELWSTSEKASSLAWQAIRTLPPLPPTPTGKPLVFEQTISFQPFETGWPPSYKLDCLPDHPVFRNAFAWDGSTPLDPVGGYPQGVTPPKHRDPPPDGCPPDSTADSIEEEEQEMKRQMDQWRWGR